MRAYDRGGWPAERYAVACFLQLHASYQSDRNVRRILKAIAADIRKGKHRPRRTGKPVDLRGLADALKESMNGIANVVMQEAPFRKALRRR